MSQQQLFVPAAPGWYVRPGDPPGITRHWDGRQWLCEVRGPVRDRFDGLRSGPLEALSAADLALLRKLTLEVSAIEDLVLSAPRADPPLVAIAPPPEYTPPPVDPYTSMPLPAHGTAGRSATTGPGQRFAGKAVDSRRRVVVIGVVAVVLVLAVIAVGLLLSGILSSR